MSILQNSRDKLLDLERQLAREAHAPTSEEGRIFVCYLDDEPPRYLIDGVEVGAGEWMERASVASPNSYRIEVGYEDQEPHQ